MIRRKDYKAYSDRHEWTRLYGLLSALEMAYARKHGRRHFRLCLAAARRWNGATWRNL